MMSYLSHNDFLLCIMSLIVEEVSFKRLDIHVTFKVFQTKVVSAHAMHQFIFDLLSISCYSYAVLGHRYSWLQTGYKGEFWDACDIVAEAFLLHARHQHIPTVLGELGILTLSTPKGSMSCFCHPQVCRSFVRGYLTCCRSFSDLCPQHKHRWTRRFKWHDVVFRIPQDAKALRLEIIFLWNDCQGVLPEPIVYVWQLNHLLGNCSAYSNHPSVSHSCSGWNLLFVCNKRSGS